MLGVPSGQGWTMNAMVALGYPLGHWGVAADRRPVHEVASRNSWSQPFGVEISRPLWEDAGRPTVTASDAPTLLSRAGRQRRLRSSRQLRHIAIPLHQSGANDGAACCEGNCRDHSEDAGHAEGSPQGKRAAH